MLYKHAQGDLDPVRELPYGPAASSLHHQRPDRWQHPTTCQNFQILLATEGAVSNRAFLVKPAERCFARVTVLYAVGIGRRGPVTEKLQNLFFDIVAGRNEKFAGWLSPV